MSLTAVNEGIGAGFVGAFEDDRVLEILGLPEHVKAVGTIALGYSEESLSSWSGFKETHLYITNTGSYKLYLDIILSC